MIPKRLKVGEKWRPILVNGETYRQVSRIAKELGMPRSRVMDVITTAFIEKSRGLKRVVLVVNYDTPARWGRK